MLRRILFRHFWVWFTLFVYDVRLHDRCVVLAEVAVHLYRHRYVFYKCTKHDSQNGNYQKNVLSKWFFKMIQMSFVVLDYHWSQALWLCSLLDLRLGLRFLVYEKQMQWKFPREYTTKQMLSRGIVFERVPWNIISIRRLSNLCDPCLAR